MSKLISLLTVAAFLACALAFLTLSTAVRETAPAVVEQAPALIREYRHTDTLDELQQLRAQERPSRPLWPFIFFLIVIILLFGMVVGTPFLKQTNSLLRQFKRRGRGHGRRAPYPADDSASSGRPIILPPTYSYGPPQLPPPDSSPSATEDTEW
ncbi:MAG: hypothetical protein KDE45_10340 [Caldilineaceae bacterium]|nr:hypothetical protein [Caldilineaceae bacterium]